jgi:hypothetical protein
MQIRHHKTKEWVQLEAIDNVALGCYVRIKDAVRETINYNTNLSLKQKHKTIQFKTNGLVGTLALNRINFIKSCAEDSTLTVLAINRYAHAYVKLRHADGDFSIPLQFVELKETNKNEVTEIKTVQQFKKTFGTLETAEAYNKTNILIEDVEATFTECLATMKKKNNDYAGENPTDVYKNLRACTQFGVPTKMGVVVRLSDKFARIGNLMSQEAAVKDEAIEDTINDAINYLAILKSILKNKIE